MTGIEVLKEAKGRREKLFPIETMKLFKDIEKYKNFCNVLKKDRYLSNMEGVAYWLIEDKQEILANAKLIGNDWKIVEEPEKSKKKGPVYPWTPLKDQIEELSQEEVQKEIGDFYGKLHESISKAHQGLLDVVGEGKTEAFNEKLQAYLHLFEKMILLKWLNAEILKNSDKLRQVMNNVKNMQEIV